MLLRVPVFLKISPPKTLDSNNNISNRKTTAVHSDLYKIQINCKDGSIVSKKSLLSPRRIIRETPHLPMAVATVPYVKVQDAEILSEKNNSHMRTLNPQL